MGAFCFIFTIRNMQRLTPHHALAALTVFGAATLALYKIAVLGGAFHLWALVVMVEVFRGALMFSQAILRGKNEYAGNIGFRGSIVFTFAIAVAGWYAAEGEAEAIYFQIANAMMLMLEYIFARLVETPTKETVSKAQYDEAMQQVEKWKQGYKSANNQIAIQGNELGVMCGKFEDAHKTQQELRDKLHKQSEVIESMRNLAPLAAQAEKYADVIAAVGVVRKHKGNYRVLCTCGEMHSVRGQKQIECGCGEIWEYEA